MMVCPKCQYARKSADRAPDWQCPNCGVAYNKVAIEAVYSGGKAVVHGKGPVAEISSPGTGNKKILFLLIIIVLAGFALWKTKHKISGEPVDAVAIRFDEAKKAFDSDNFQKATQEFTVLAEKGNSRAQYYLGRIYALNKTITHMDGHYERIKPDHVKSVLWYTKAAEQGELLAQIELGKVFEEGIGGSENLKGGEKPDLAQSALWYKKASDQGDAYAQYRLGFLAENGADKDYTQAAQWYRMAAEQGYGGGLYSLGVLYAGGRGVSRNLITAYELMSLAAEQNHRDPTAEGTFWAKSTSEEIARQIDRSELTVANSFVAAWKPGQPLPF